MDEPINFEVIFENGSYKIKNGRNLCLEFKFIERDEFELNKSEDEGENEEQDEDKGTVLYISKIYKCSNVQYSRKLINMIEEMVKSIPEPPWSSVRYITLEDGSSINVCPSKYDSGMDIDLRYLKILMTGQSWYNSFGYKSVNHEANVAYNSVIINKPMHWLLSEFFDEEYIEKKFKRRFPELSLDLTVQRYVSEMTKDIPKSGTISCTKEQQKRASLLFNLVYYIARNQMLQYDFRLQKKVERTPKCGGYKKKTIQNSRIKLKKIIRKSINAKQTKMINQFK